jgi:hypothetical protein
MRQAHRAVGIEFTGPDLDDKRTTAIEPARMRLARV